MSHFYTVVPFNQDEALCQWLRESQVVLAPDLATGRAPTLADIAAVFRQTRSYDVEYRRSTCGYDIDIKDQQPSASRRYTTIWITDYQGDDHQPLNISFYNGWASLALEIVQHLSRRCGPFVVIAHAVGKPMVVTPQTPLEEAHIALEGW